MIRLHAEDELQPARSPWRAGLFEVIFHSDTRAGRAFDLTLLVLILASVAAVSLETVPWFQERHGEALRVWEWAVTIVFTVEYLLRMVCVSRPKHYLLSFYGIVDLLSILPSYLSLVVAGAHYLLVVRILRLLRIFRILKLTRFLSESSTLSTALYSSRHKIGVFLYTVLLAVTIIGAMMYVVEGPASGFTSIPTSIYWAIVTLTTVGYGDISPVTPLGQFLASLVMILGYGVIAVPTGIVTTELAAARDLHAGRICPNCGRGRHDGDAHYCKHCGNPLAGS